MPASVCVTANDTWVASWFEGLDVGLLIGWAEGLDVG